MLEAVLVVFGIYVGSALLAFGMIVALMWLLDWAQRRGLI